MCAVAELGYNAQHFVVDETFFNDWIKDSGKAEEIFKQELAELEKKREEEAAAKKEEEEAAAKKAEEDAANAEDSVHMESQHSKCCTLVTIDSV